MTTRKGGNLMAVLFRRHHESTGQLNSTTTTVVRPLCCSCAQRSHPVADQSPDTHPQISPSAALKHLRLAADRDPVCRTVARLREWRRQDLTGLRLDRPREDVF